MMLSRPPPPRLVVPAPSDALLDDADAAALARAMVADLVVEEVPAFAQTPRPGDWRLLLSAQLRGTQVLPHFQLVDGRGGSRGDVTGAPVPATGWAQADPDLIRQVADQAAPEILNLLRTADAQIKQSDPNSLYNRPARIFFAGVKGAPGDGNVSLARGMRLKIPGNGEQLVTQAALADFTVQGVVKLTDEPDHQQQVEIHWLVIDGAGHEVGDIAQGHDVAAGTLNGFWGEIADVITDQAAGGVSEVITNASGRRRTEPPKS